MYNTVDLLQDVSLQPDGRKLPSKKIRSKGRRNAAQAQKLTTEQEDRIYAVLLDK